MANCNCFLTCSSTAMAAKLTTAMTTAIDNKKKSIFAGWVKEGITFSIKRKKATNKIKFI